VSQKYSDLNDDLQNCFEALSNTGNFCVSRGDGVAQQFNVLFNMFQADELTVADFTSNVNRVLLSGPR